ncbi:MAG: hypothetical protein R2883_07765 [Caldisericia bacterium]
MQCSKSEIDIPIVWYDQVYEYEEFFVDNIGGETLTGTVSFSRKWVTTTNPSFNISGDEGEQVLIRFDANGQVEGKYKIMMKVDTNGGEITFLISVNIVKRPDTIITLTIGNKKIIVQGQTTEIVAWRKQPGNRNGSIESYH